MIADYDALMAENLALHEQVAALQSREVCAAAHDDVEECGWCQRDRLRETLKALADENARLRECLKEMYESDGESSEAFSTASELLYGKPLCGAVGHQTLGKCPACGNELVEWSQAMSLWHDRKSGLAPKVK